MPRRALTLTSVFRMLPLREMSRDSRMISRSKAFPAHNSNLCRKNEQREAVSFPLPGIPDGRRILSLEERKNLLADIYLISRKALIIFCNSQWLTPLPVRLSLYSFSVGNPAPIHFLQPPSIDSTFVYPIFCKLSADNAERNPPPQYRISFASVSGTRRSMSRSIMPLPR